jgi:MFS transporter, Spinster family, sphingosine-1-phosphate transporter
LGPLSLSGHAESSSVSSVTLNRQATDRLLHPRNRKLLDLDLTSLKNNDARIKTSTHPWLLVAVLGVAAFLNNCDRHVVFSLFPVLRSELNFTDVQLGLTGSLFLWVYAICNPISGQIGDRFSKRTLISLSLVLWSSVTALTGLSRSAGMLLACRALLGITESLFMPAAMALLASAHGPRTRSLAMNVFGIGEFAGIATGGWYGSFMGHRFHWRLPFLSLGLLGILYAPVCAAFLRNTDQETFSKLDASSRRVSLTALVKISTFRLLCIIVPVCTGTLWLLYTWLPLFLYEKFSLNLAEAGFTAAAYLQSASLIGSLAGAAFADWLYARTNSSRFLTSSAGFFLAAPCLYFIGNSESLFFTKLAAVGFGLMGGLFMANVTAAAFDVVPAETRASAFSLINFGAASASGFAALLAGRWKESVGIQNAISCAAVACVVAGLLLLVSIRFYFQEDFRRAHPAETC